MRVAARSRLFVIRRLASEIRALRAKASTSTPHEQRADPGGM
jgi:hypothetical protein